MKNYITVGIVALIVGLIVGFVLHQTPTVSGASSATGAYNNGVGYSAITLLPTTANGTSTAILNTGASDRAVIGTQVMCTGVGSSQTFSTGAGLTSTGWTLTAATSTVTGTYGTNSNYILNTTLATTSGIIYNASSTEGILTYTSRIWPVNTYLVFNFNATNTAACGLGVTWLPL